jgi:K(+)-stimulated pyrophosphate-energized sodium pump
VVEAGHDHHLRHARRRVIPEVTTFFTRRTRARAGSVRRAEAAASLNVLSGLTAGNFSAFWIGES